MTLDSTRRFRQDLRRIAARNYDLRKLVTIVDTLLNDDILDPKYQDHALKGKYSDLRECHISFNWLLASIEYRMISWCWCVREHTQISFKSNHRYMLIC